MLLGKYAYLIEDIDINYLFFRLQAVIEASLRWDVDDDGIIDNSGFPDQTYDAWSVVGAR